MTKNTYFILLALFFLAACSSEPSEAPLVLDSFNNYKASILTDKGEEAIKFVDSRTLKYYTNILDKVKTADSTAVAGLPILDKLMVLTIRHKTPKEEILAFDGKGLLLYAIEKGMISKNSVSETTIENITVDGNFAKGQFVSKGKKAPIFFHFYKEDGNWKVDLTSILNSSAAAFTKMMKDSGQEENAFFMSLMEMMSGQKPRSDIWQPVQG